MNTIYVLIASNIGSKPQTRCTIRGHSVQHNFVETVTLYSLQFSERTVKETHQEGRLADSASVNKALSTSESGIKEIRMNSPA